MAITATVVLDPGHGGTQNIGGSDANHAVSPSGVREKDMTLDIARRVRRALQDAAAGGGHNITVLMTRDSDVNLSLRDRAGVARTNRADRFLSIHFNGFNNVTRGVEAHIRPESLNVNFAADMRFARRVQQAAFRAVEAADSGTNDRGVFQNAFGVLRDDNLGNTNGNRRCRACLLELEFIDVRAVDRLLNTGPNASAVRAQVAEAIAGAIIEDLTNP